MKPNFVEKLINKTLEFGVTNSISSPVINLEHGWSLCAWTKWTKISGTVAGTVKVEKSINGEDWYQATSDNLTDANGNVEKDIIDIPYAFARVTITLTGGKASFVTDTYTKAV